MNRMKKLFLAFFVVVMALGLGIESAEAARLGGGRSSGMQRQMTPRPSPTPSRQATPQPTPAGTPAPAPQRSWLGPLAGLAAGIGLGALFSHLGMGAGMANIMTMLLVGMVVFFVFRLIARKMAPPPRAEGQTQFAGLSPVENPSYTPPMTPPVGSTTGDATGSGSATPNSATNAPADFDTDAFLRVAKLNFVRLQAANDEKNLADIREFVSPEMYAEIKLQMDERGNVPQQTDVVTLNAEFIELVTENAQHIASVRFSGMIREEANSAAVAFAELWHLGKPIDGSRGWQIYGIQQVSN